MTDLGSTVITIPPCQTGEGTIRLVEDYICAKILDGVHFDFDFSFIRPEAKEIIRELVDGINQDAERQVLIIGHTDRSGSDQYNQGLSRRRARSVFAYVTNDVAGWMELLRTMLSNTGNDTTPRVEGGQSADRWQIREIQYMLSYIRNPAGAFYYTGPVDNLNGGGTQAALQAFRTDNGLPPGGGPGPRRAGIDEETWQRLFEVYIALDALQVDTTRFLDPSILGCGENYPRIETRPPGTEGEDRRDADARLETNRRVEFLLIPPERVPEVLTCDAIYNDPNSPVVVCPTDPQPITITLRFLNADGLHPFSDDAGNPITLTANITGQGGWTWQRQTNAQGQIVLDDEGTVQGDYRVSVEGNYALVLRDRSLGSVRGAEVLLRLRTSTAVDLLVTPVPARLNFVEDQDPFDQEIDQVPNPLESPTPVVFRLAADIEGVTGDTVVVRLSSFLLRGPLSQVPGEPGGGGGGAGGGVITPATPLEFIDPVEDTPLQDAGIDQRFRLRLTSGEVVGDEITVMVSGHWFRAES